MISLILKYKKQIFTLSLLILLSAFLRFQYLGYSEFQDDEKKAVISPKKGSSVDEFLLNQRKGPMQFFVTQLTINSGIDKKDEASMRIPFAALSTFSVVIFYLILAQYFKSETVRFLGSTLFLVNGFFVGFGRIVQYQNINIFFSLLSLLMFILLAKKGSKHVLYGLFGVIFFSISLLAHWDAVFFVLPISLLFLQFLLKKNVTTRTKVLTTLSCFVLGCIILLPYLLPYKEFQLSNPDNLKYYDKRVGISTYPLERHKFIFELYNPYITLYLLIALVTLSVVTIKKSWMFWIWFIFNFLAIRYLMQKPGTHIYNYVIPALFLSTFAIELFLTNKRIFKVSLLVLIVFLGMLYYQSYMLFVDHKLEYPWDSKTVFKIGSVEYKNPEYIDAEVLTFGFPHYRNWKGINAYVKSNPDKCSYITNEGKEISQIYMTAGYGKKDSRPCYYVVEVKRPFITGAREANFPESSGKKPMFTYTNPYSNETLVKVFRKNQRVKK